VTIGIERFTQGDDSSFRAHSDPPANGAFELADQAATEFERT
jgi:hypothetical protein